MSIPLAVHVQSVCKSYGKKPVLKELSMRVPRGSIYGLLGASGCGKTTLLSCLVGRKQFDSGDVEVLGARPGMVGSGVPGPRVGYMPQDIALVGEFTVMDSIFYFGRIFDMPEKLINERFRQLSQLLELPPDDRFVRNCSGGQQRRISFAASMVHMPELLILDEPTVGVDPVLRERIWDYLVEITQQGNMAVIITTHYIEEARQANVIGLMRDGRLLAEESPSRLLSMFHTDQLEQVFLILSQKQNDGQTISQNAFKQFALTDGSMNSLNTTQGSQDMLTKKKKEKRMPGYGLNGKRMRALLDKNWKQFYRNTTGVIFMMLFPIIQNVVFLLSVGGDIRGINLAVVNDETMTTRCNGFIPNETAIPIHDGEFSTSCHFQNLSCRFLEHLENPMINKIKYESVDSATQAVKHGDVVGVLYMAANFSESFEERIEKGKDVDNETLPFSQIQVFLDMSNRQIGATLKYKLLALYVDFQKALSIDCKVDKRQVDFIELDTLYGTLDDTYLDFMTPGLVLTMMFFMMSLVTSQIIITDRAEGLWDRSAIAGVTSLEITLTHFITQSNFVVIYTLVVLTITFGIFQIEYVGSLWIMGVLTLLQGWAGMIFGFWISIVSVNLTMANIISTGNFYVMILLCGLMWPIQGMPVWLQWISNCLPFTIAIQSFRNVMKKGWSIYDLEVLNGIGVELLWIVVLAVANVMLLKSKR